MCYLHHWSLQGRRRGNGPPQGYYSHPGEVGREWVEPWHTCAGAKGKQSVPAKGLIDYSLPGTRWGNASTCCPLLRLDCRVTVQPYRNYYIYRCHLYIKRSVLLISEQVGRERIFSEGKPELTSDRSGTKTHAEQLLLLIQRGRMTVCPLLSERPQRGGMIG